MKAQVAVEYLMLIGVILVVLIPLFYFSTQEASSEIKINQADEAMTNLAITADAVYALGPGSKDIVKVTIPKGFVDVNAINNELRMNISTKGSYSSLHKSTKANLQLGNFPTSSGTYFIPVEALDTGEVKIG